MNDNLGLKLEKVLFVSNPPFSLSLEIISDVVRRLENCAKEIGRASCRERV